LAALRRIKPALSRSIVAATYDVIFTGKEQTVLATTTYIRDFFLEILKGLYFGGQ